MSHMRYRCRVEIAEFDLLDVILSRGMSITVYRDVWSA